VHASSIIEGRRVKPPPGVHALPVICPTTEERIGALDEADAAEVGAAVSAARRAFDSGPWPRLTLDARKDILYAIRDRLRACADELAYLESLNAGLPIARVREQIGRAARNFEVYAEIASTLTGETYTGLSGFLTYVTREPKGVAALIAPWNAPLALGSMRVAGCIAFGNTCVLKPSEHTPLSTLRMVEIFHEAGLPPGVVNLVNGRGAVTGAALVAHPDIDMVGFTGGTETGRAVMAAAGRNLKPCLMELGGKSACIIHSSADLELALDGALGGIYSNNGQQCLAGSRILVQRTIAEDFIARFTERARRIRIGDPLDPATEMGPLAFADHLRRVLSYVDVARAEGARLLCGGRRPPGLARGYYLEPTAVLVDSNQSRLCREEIFGPFATFMLYDTLDEAIAIANDSAYGLVGYVWAEDLEAVMRATRAIRAGTLWVNTTMVRELRAPFGGFKQSGVGRDGARSSAEFYTELKTTTIAIDRPVLAKFGA